MKEGGKALKSIYSFLSVLDSSAPVRKRFLFKSGTIPIENKSLTAP